MDADESDGRQDEPGGNIEQPIAPVERPHAAVDNPTGDNHSNQKEKKNWPQRVEAVCAVLLVIITGFYTYYAAGQLHKMRRATKAAEDSANAAKSAANIAESALQFQQQEFRTQQRPYIYPVPIRNMGAPDCIVFTPIGNDLYSVGCAVGMRNSGLSPAVEIVHTMSEVRIGH
jgi:hypothetical protein